MRNSAVGQSPQHHRVRLATRGGTGELAVVINTPGGERTVRTNRQVARGAASRLASCRDGDHGFALNGATSGGDEDRSGIGGGYKVVVIVHIAIAPLDQRAIGAKGQGVVIACGDLHHSFARQHAVGIDQARHVVICQRTITQLTVTTIAPCGNRAVRAKCEIVINSGGHRHHPFAGQHSQRIHSHRDRGCRSS